MTAEPFTSEQMAVFQRSLSDVSQAFIDSILEVVGDNETADKIIMLAGLKVLENTINAIKQEQEKVIGDSSGSTGGGGTKDFDPPSFPDGFLEGIDWNDKND